MTIVDKIPAMGSPFKEERARPMVRKMKPVLLRIDDIHIPKRDFPEFEFPPTSRAFETLKKTLKKRGMKMPVFVNQDKLLLGGHYRLWAWKLLGNRHIPAIVVDKWDEIQQFFE